MKRLSGKEMCKILKRRGWGLDRINGSHHIYKHPDGRTVSIPVHGKKILKPKTQRTIMRGAGLTDVDL